MQVNVLRKLFLGFIQIHILSHGAQQAFFGLWIIEELRKHGYEMSAGTLYPLLHSMEKAGLIEVEKKKEQGKIRKYYLTTSLGKEVLEEAKIKIKELTSEL